MVAAQINFSPKLFFSSSLPELKFEVNTYIFKWEIHLNVQVEPQVWAEHFFLLLSQATERYSKFCNLWSYQLS